MKGISVIICCYNSSSRLLQTLFHLSIQKLKIECLVEIIIVDNNSTDNTRKLAYDYWKSYNSSIPFRVVEEKKPGLTFARFRGIKESKYEYLLFCDDDNWLNSMYIQNGFSILEKNSRIGALGGFGKAAFENNVLEPEWFYYYENIYALGKQGVTSGDITFQKLYVYGAGMFIRKKALNGIDVNTIIFSDMNATTTTATTAHSILLYPNENA